MTQRPHAALLGLAFVAVSLHASAPRRVHAAPAVTPLVDHAAVRAACAEAGSDAPRRLYSVDVAPHGWRFVPYDAEDAFLAIDSRHNLRALRGSLELIASRLEPIGFAANEERATALVAASREAKLRIGFFLGFDNRSRTLCVLRPTVGVTTARVDVAFVEVVDASGTVLAREETERFRAYADDAERNAIPGEGPRAAVADPRVLRGSALSPAQRRAWADAQGTLRTALARCYADALGRGAPREAQSVVRLTVDPAGAVQQAETELSTLADVPANACVVEAFRATRLSPATPASPALLEVGVRWVAD